MHIAPLKQRFLALFIDLCVIILYAVCLLGATLAFYQFILGSIPNTINGIDINLAHLIGFTTLTFPVGLYFFFAEAGKHRATLGKRIAKVKVSSKNKKNVTKKQIAIRTIVKLLPWEFAHTFVYQVVYYSSTNTETPLWVLIGLCIANLLPLAYVSLVLIRKDRAGPHDLVARTIVTTS